MKAFKAYDIRGVYNKDFNSEDVYRIGFYLPELLHVDTILIGRDIRVSSPVIFETLTRGITDAGANVDSLGLATTPLVYWTTAKYGYHCSVQITASHNAPEYNGLKVSGKDAAPIGYDNGLQTLEQLIKITPIPTKQKGVIKELHIESEYVQFLSQYKSDISGLNIAMDLSNGMAGLFARPLFGDAPNYLFEEPDGTFPNHYPNPLEPKNIVALQQYVQKNSCDIGVIFDGDADRVMFVDEKGTFISPDLMIAVLGNYFLNGDKKARVLQDIRTSKAVGEYLVPMGAEMHMWRVGRAYAARKLKEIDGLFGGELAGHYYFKDFYYSDSGLMAALILLGIIANKKSEGISVSQLISSITAYHNSGEINFRIEKKQEAMDAVKKHYFSLGKPERFFDFDGYRIEYPGWWLNIRPSNTEPYLRFLAEAKNPEVLKNIVDTVTGIIQQLS